MPSGGDSLLVQTPIAGGASAAQYGIADRLGSTRLLTNASAQTQGTLAYDAFGVPKAPSGGSGTATTPLGFTGQLTDGESGLVDLRARLYDPTTGQFLSRDTYAGSAANPLSLNLYSYGANDPTRLVDPSGHNSITTYFDEVALGACSVGGPALAMDVRVVQRLLSAAIGFLPGVGDGYFLTMAITGQDPLTGDRLSTAERWELGGLAAASLVTELVGVGVLGQEALAGERLVTELGAVSRLERLAADDAKLGGRGLEGFAGLEGEARAAEGAGRDASAAGRDLREVSAGADAARGEGGYFPESEQLPYTPQGKVFGQAQAGSCVAGCARMVLSDFGKDIPEAYIRQAAGVDPEGGLISDLPDAFAELGGPQASFVKGGTLEDLQRATSGSVPAIVRVQGPLGRHALVLDAFAETDIGTTALIRDPLPQEGAEAGGSAYQVLLETFLGAWTGDFVHFP